MMYLVVILTASMLLNLFLFVERQSLLKERANSTRKLTVLKRQVIQLRQAFTSVITQLQKSAHAQYLALEFEDSQEQQVVKFFLDKLAAIMLMQVETGLPHRKALTQIDDSDGLSLIELDKYFKAQDRELQRLWQSQEPDALLELTQVMMQKVAVEMKTKAPVES